MLVFSFVVLTFRRSPLQSIHVITFYIRTVVLDSEICHIRQSGISLRRLSPTVRNVLQVQTIAVPHEIDIYPLCRKWELGFIIAFIKYGIFFILNFCLGLYPVPLTTGLWPIFRLLCRCTQQNHGAWNFDSCEVSHHGRRIRRWFWFYHIRREEIPFFNDADIF